MSGQKCGTVTMYAASCTSMPTLRWSGVSAGVGRQKPFLGTAALATSASASRERAFSPPFQPATPISVASTPAANHLPREQQPFMGSPLKLLAGLLYETRSIAVGEM